MDGKALLIFAALLLFVHAKPLDPPKCGYASCRAANQDSISVHLIPHSHDDVGWLKTVDQYYFGSRTGIQRAGVQYILDSVVRALDENKERRFIQVETAFFYKWWNRQDDAVKDKVRRLVGKGQLEFVGGGWSMNDEAAVHYHSVVDQFAFGLMFLNDTFGKCGRPKIGWQIDPFGHSKEMAAIFSQLGYDGLFFARLDWRDKSQRLSTRTSEMLWQGSSSLGNSSNIFTSILYNHYSAPPGYCFDVLCQDDPIIDDQKSTEYNQKNKVEQFADFVGRQSERYPTSNILVTMGDDFNYQDAHYYFSNLDRLIEGFKLWPQTYKGKPIEVFYSTPSCYVKAVNEEATSVKQAFPLKTDDFFPYASDYHAYWSGYYTSRPTSKRFERQASNLLQIHKQLASSQMNKPSDFFYLENAVGIMQHHDAITGTEKQHVADDYAKIVHSAILQSNDEINTMISNLLDKTEDNSLKLNLQTCLLANVSICPQSMDDDFVVAIYNPLSRPVDFYARLPVNYLDYNITGPRGESLDYQMSPTMSTFDKLPEAAKYELTFLAEDVPPLGLKVYTVSKIQDVKESGYILQPSTEPDEVFDIRTDPSTGTLRSVVHRGTEIEIDQELLYYEGAQGDNSAFEKRASGAYIFRPNGTARPFSDSINSTIYHGVLFVELHQVYADWAKQIVRLYKRDGRVELDWMVGPIPIGDSKGKEIISRFKARDVNSEDVFYTDSNGKEMIERRRFSRTTYNYTNEEPIAGNYNPVTTRITIRDDQKRMSVLTDRAQGGSSLRSGELELMVHRRLLYDDAFGVGEALNESDFNVGLVARGSHLLLIGPQDDDNVRKEKRLQQEKVLSPWMFVTRNDASREGLEKNMKFEFTALFDELPENVQILTLQPHPTKTSSLIIRLEHIYEVDEHSELSREATVDLSHLFSKFTIKGIRETTLGANEWADEDEILEWIVGEPLEEADYSEGLDKGREEGREEGERGSSVEDLLVTLWPSQIKTFIVDVAVN